MKIVMRVLLTVAILLLVYVCWRSIQGPIDFNAEVAKRDRAVIQRLIDIRTAQVSFRAKTGSYTASLDTLMNFVKTGQVITLRKAGDLTEDQLEKGMTEDKAMQIIRTRDEKKIRAAGLWDEERNAPQLERDSIFSPALEVLFANRTNFRPDSLAYVPFGNGARFEIATDSLITASGYPVQVLEVKTPFTVYLGDLDKRLLQQKIQAVLDLPGNRFPGLMIGSLEVANNNAGNWE